MTPTPRLTHFDLCTGIGGFALGFQAEGFTTVGFSEVDDAAITVFKHWFPEIKNYGDLRQIGQPVRDEVGAIDCLTGGIPCQPASLLGRRRGTLDERWLWPDAIRVLGVLRPAVAVFENPPAILTLEQGSAFNGIVSGISALGYDVLWDVVPAAAFGAGHLRKRLLVVCADAQGVTKRIAANETNALTDGGNSRTEPTGLLHLTKVGVAPNAHHARLQGHAGDGEGIGGPQAGRSIAPPDLRGRVSCEDWWHEAHTGIPVLAHGISTRLAEATARCAGNAIVPQVARMYARAIRNFLLRTHTP